MQRRQFIQLGAFGLLSLHFPRFAFADAPLTLPAELQHNPLLNFSGLPTFSKFKPEYIKPAVNFLVQQCRDVTTQVSTQSSITWENFYQPLADVNDKLDRVWSVVRHLHSVKNSDELRKVYQEARKVLTEYGTWVGQNPDLYNAYQKLKESAEFATFSVAQQKAIDDALLDFKLSGIGLSAEDQKKYAELKKRLSELSSTFSNNVLDANMGWSKTVTDVNQLKGLSERALAAAKESAKSKNEEGYRFTLDYPSYSAVLTYCENRALREEMYRASNTKASDQGPNAGKWDNTPVIDELLKLRLELANLLGFKTYADYSLAKKMAESPEQVLDFLNGLVERAKPQGEKELAQLKDYVKTQFGITELAPWDIAFYSEKQKEALYSISDEELRPYFPEKKAIEGLFEITKRLFNVTIKEKVGVDTWDSSVKYYEIFDEQQTLIAGFYFDLYAREHKRGGAWMSECIGRRKLSDGNIQLPVAFLTCNFAKPVEGKPSILLHDEVVTMFHEFGHGLHHMLTRIDVPSVSGINGVPWDAVEFPSQTLENWCWEEESLALISEHYETKAPLPKALLDKVLAAKNYQAALFMLRQLEFGLFDFRLNYEYQPEKAENYVLNMLKDVQSKVAVIPSPEWARRPHSFNHIFSGGYAAGYYSYMWADVLAADSFSLFAEKGIFNPEVGKAFLDSILSQGGSRPPMALFEQFRGRKPKLDALLKQKGIIN
ncbi:MAG: oligopeptidase A [Pasteurellaceae bacterium]|nr:oligopeptidase A [Pasteurellaceae bacterium]